jgi:hypothetical protein
VSDCLHFVPSPMQRSEHDACVMPGQRGHCPHSGDPAFCAKFQAGRAEAAENRWNRAHDLFHRTLALLDWITAAATGERPWPDGDSEGQATRHICDEWDRIEAGVDPQELERDIATLRACREAAEKVVRELVAAIDARLNYRCVPPCARIEDVPHRDALIDQRLAESAEKIRVAKASAAALGLGEAE